MRSRRGVGLVATVGVVTLLLAALVFLVVGTMQSALGQQIQATAKSDAVLTSSAVRLQMDDLRTLVHAYAVRPILVAAMGDGSAASHDTYAINGALSQLSQSRTGVLYAWVTLPNGLLTQDAPYDAAILDKNFACRDWYQGAMRSTQPYLSEAYVSANIGNKLVVAASNQIVDRFGKTVGIVAFSYLLNSTNDIIHQYTNQLSKGGAPLSVWVTDQSGTVVAEPATAPIDHLIRVGQLHRNDSCQVRSTTSPDTQLATTDPQIAAVLSTAIAGQAGATNFSPSSSQVIGWTRDPSLAWAVAVSVPAATQAQNVSNLTALVVVASGVALLIVLIVVVRLGLALRSVDNQRVDLDRLSRIDALTGAYNRRHLSVAARELLSTANRTGNPLGVLMVDVDFFKLINDTHGHAVGDAVLQQIVQRCRENLRTGDIVGRWGGEEFLILLPNTTLPAAINVAEKLRAAIARVPLVVKGKQMAITVSIGCASEAQGQAEPLVGNADVELYRAKEGGRNRVRPVPAVKSMAPTTTGPA